MSFIANHENKILAKISESSVTVVPSLFWDHLNDIIPSILMESQAVYKTVKQCVS